MRDSFRSGDVWLAHYRLYGDVKRALVPIEAAQATARLAVPFEPREWLAERKVRLVEGLDRLANAAHNGRIPGGAIENGELRIARPATAMPEDVDELVLDLYRRLPEVQITHILPEVDAATGFTDAFTHLRTGAPCKDRIGLLNVLLAEGLNLGLSKMAEASNTHDFFQLSRLSRWHIESAAINRALAMVIEAQAQLPMASYCGLGLTAFSDGQFFPAARQGEAMNLVNARYGSEPGLKAYTHVSDQFEPFATQTIPATVTEAPYILDGLLMTRAGRRIREQYAGSGGFTGLVFAATSLLCCQFIPRIRDLPSKRLHVFDPGCVPKPLIGLTGNRIREDVIVRNWPDILRVAATLASGALPPSQLLRKFAAYPRQHELAVALREIGLVERTLFIVDWLLDADMQRRANTGLNKGEAHHALKNALRIGRQGEIRDRSSEGQHYRMAGLNLLAAIVIHWNTAHLGEAVRQRKHAGLTVEPELLAHISPLGGPTSCSPANTGGQSADSGLSVRFCLLPESTPLSRLNLLIIDELGFVPLSRTGTELLFDVFSQRYERGSILVTTNLPFDEWTEVFGSERLTGALLDRLTHHVHILEMNGESYRLKRSRENVALQAPDDREEE